MGRLTWDAASDRIYETGVDRVILFRYKEDGSGYDNGVAWNGVTGVTESPEGADANDIYADNIKYLSLISAENWKGTVKAYTYPKEFSGCMGEYEFDNGTRKGVFFGQQPHVKFGIAWRTIVGNAVLGDSYGYKLHVAYGLTAAPSERDHATVNDSPEATEFSWEINSIPEAFTKKFTGDTDVLKPVSHIVVDSVDNADFYSWLEEQLLGTENTNSTLPLPDDFVDEINAA